MGWEIYHLNMKIDDKPNFSAIEEVGFCSFGRENVK
jgi:hypothetical protein